MANNILALDVGEKRIGVAIANTEARLPAPLMTLPHVPSIVSDIQQLISTHDVSMVIVGLPRNMSGEDTAQTAYVRRFVDELQLTTPYLYQDEALTSRKAEEELRARGKPYAKGDVDALAATYILEDYLTHQG